MHKIASAFILGSVLLGPANAATPPPAVTATPPVRTVGLVNFDTCKMPGYPKLMAQYGITGTVVLHFLVDKDGKVRDSRVALSSGQVILDEAARTAIAKCTFTPVTEHGVAVEAWVPVQYVWTVD